MTDPQDIVADIGGTNTRVAVAVRGELDTGSIMRFRNADHADFYGVLEAYRSETNLSVARVCVALAGPVRDGRGRLTNLDWDIGADAAAKAAGAQAGVLFNDLQAQGYGLTRLGEASLRAVQPGGDAHPQAARLVVGVGTGFNVAPVLHTGHGWIVPAAEAGHITLPVRSGAELAFADKLTEHHGFASVEDMLSGRGFERIYRHLSGAEKDAASIMEALETGEDASAEAAAQAFVQMLGRVSGDLALIHQPFGGLYFAGGVARAFSAKFERFGFAEAFRDKGRFSDMMDAFPISVIEDDYAALSGCAAYLEDNA